MLVCQKLYLNHFQTVTTSTIFYEGGGGGLPNKGRYGCAGPGIRYFRGKFLPGH